MFVAQYHVRTDEPSVVEIAEKRSIPAKAVFKRKTGDYTRACCYGFGNVGWK
jgi:hypothetical protein